MWTHIRSASCPTPLSTIADWLLCTLSLILRPNLVGWNPTTVEGGRIRTRSAPAASVLTATGPQQPAPPARMDGTTTDNVFHASPAQLSKIMHALLIRQLTLVLILVLAYCTTTAVSTTLRQGLLPANGQVSTRGALPHGTTFVTATTGPVTSTPGPRRLEEARPGPWLTRRS